MRRFRCYVAYIGGPMRAKTRTRQGKIKGVCPMRTLLAFILLFTSASLQAALIPVVLDSVVIRLANGGDSPAIIEDSTASWVYDTATGVVTGSGLYSEQNKVGLTSVYTNEIMNLSVGGGLAATATAFDCNEGDFGALVGASICANVGWGTNAINESTFSYGPGLNFERIIGGDDVDLGPMVHLDFYDGMTTSIDGITVVLSSVTDQRSPGDT